MLRYISQKEIAKLGGEKFSFAFLYILDRVRAIVKKSINFHCGYEKGIGHKTNSPHYLVPCQATDVHLGSNKDEKIKDADRVALHKELDKMINSTPSTSVLDNIALIRLSGVKRIGIYPDWKPKLGYHLDDEADRPVTLWIGLNREKFLKKATESKDSQIYINLLES